MVSFIFRVLSHGWMNGSFLETTSKKGIDNVALKDAFCVGICQLKQAASVLWWHGLRLQIRVKVKMELDEEY